MFDNPSFDRHERVVFAHDAASGLPAIVAPIFSRARADNRPTSEIADTLARQLLSEVAR